MNAARRKELSKAADLIAEALGIVQGCADEEREAYDSLSESAQNGERGERMSEAADALDAAVCALEEAAEGNSNASEA